MISYKMYSYSAITNVLVLILYSWKCTQPQVCFIQGWVQLHKIISITITLNFNYNYSHNFLNQLQLHCFNYNYIMRIQIYSEFVNYVFLRVLLNFNILYTIDKQI